MVQPFSRCTATIAARTAGGMNAFAGYLWKLSSSVGAAGGKDGSAGSRGKMGVKFEADGGKYCWMDDCVRWQFASSGVGSAAVGGRFSIPEDAVCFRFFVGFETGS